MQPPLPPKSVYAAGAHKINYEKALKAASTILEDVQYYNISKPKDSVAAFTVTSLSNDPLHESATDAVYIDQYSGKVLGTMLFTERSLGSQVRSTFRPIHVGSIYGTGSKILSFIVCLFGVSFPVTGVVMWINRKKKKKKKTIARSLIKQNKESIIA